MKVNKKAVVLLSGGLDSATCLAIAKQDNYDCYALSFDYGQRHSAEIHAAKKVAQSFSVKEHQIFPFNLSSFGGSALTDTSIHVPKQQTEGIPITYVPARNTIFLSIALAWAEVLNAEVIYTGVNAVDYSGYPDCRPEYIQAFQTMADLATKAGIEGHGPILKTPLIHKTKVDIIRLGLSLAVDYSLTVSCYQANHQGAACGLCDSCRIRKNAFEQIDIDDPTLYVS